MHLSSVFGYFFGNLPQIFKIYNEAERDRLCIECNDIVWR